MARYIDADLLLAQCRRNPWFEKTEEDKRMIYIERSIIDATPTADVVPKSQLDLYMKLYRVTMSNDIKIPCRVGDEVYAIRKQNQTWAVKKGKVSEMYFVDETMRLCIVVKGVSRGEWGKVVFPSYEEAMQRIGQIRRW